MGRSRRPPEPEALAVAAEARLALRLLTLVHDDEPEVPAMADALPLQPSASIRPEETGEAVEELLPTEALDGLPAEASPPPIETEDLLRGFLELLPPRQQFIVQARLEGRSAVDIAGECWPGRSERTGRRGVARELTDIRAAWERFVLEGRR